MSLLTRLFGKTKTSSEILCPRCERAMEADHECRKGVSRRHFFGMLGGAAAAVALPRPPGTGGLFNPRVNVFRQYRLGKMAVSEIGLGLRFVSEYDPAKDLFTSRIDALYGFDPIQLAPDPPCIIRILS